MVRDEVLSRWQMSRRFTVMALPLVAATVVVYVAAFVLWKYVGTLHQTDAANQWLSALVTTALAVAACSGWLRHSRRARFIELSELFASVHAEITSPDVLRLIDTGKNRPDELDALDQKAMKETYLRNSARIDVIVQYEKTAIDLALEELEKLARRKASPDKETNPFAKLFKRVEEALKELGAALPSDDPDVAAQKAQNSRTFKQNHAKNSGIQQLYSDVAAFFAGRPMTPGESADLQVEDLPYTRVRLSKDRQAVELLNVDATEAPNRRVWIAGSGAGDPLAASTEHRDRKGPDGKKQKCDFNSKATRDEIVGAAQSGDRELDGMSLGDALVAYFRGMTRLPGNIACPHCHDLVAFNQARVAGPSRTP